MCSLKREVTMNISEKVIYQIPEETLVKNMVQCPKCGTIIESKHSHHFISCECGSVSIDGGTGCRRTLWDGERIKHDEIINLCEYEIRPRNLLQDYDQDKFNWLVENNFPRKYNQWSEEQKMFYKLTWD